MSPGSRFDKVCRGRFGLHAASALVIEIISAFELRHRKLVSHRDLKPENILVNQEGEIRLLDFGIAKILQPDVPDDTTTIPWSQPIPAPCSPEQLAGKTLELRAMCINWAYLLYLLLTVNTRLLAGHRPGRTTQSHA